jgi:hypothetical protein
MVASVARAITDEGHHGEIRRILNIQNANCCVVMDSAIQIFPFLTPMRITLAHECSEEISYLAS